MIIRELAARLGLEIDGDAFMAADRALGVVKGGLLAIGALAGTAALGLAAAAAKTAQYADQIKKASLRTGIGVESLQALRYAAERADVDMGGLQQALNFMARRGVKDFEAEFRRAADELDRMPDGGAKAQRAIQLFGRSGAALLPMMKGGSAAIDEMTRKAREMGIVLSADVIEAGAETKDAIEDMQGSLRGLVYMLGAPLLKPLQKVLDRFSAWIRANRQLMAQKVEAALGLLVKGLEAAWRLAEPVVDLVVRLARALNEMWNASAELRVAIIALGVAVLAAFFPAAAVLAAFLMVLEEVWGYFTGERKTLLEDWLGPWKEYKETLDKIRPVLKEIIELLDLINPVAQLRKIPGQIAAWGIGRHSAEEGPTGRLVRRVAELRGKKDLSDAERVELSKWESVASGTGIDLSQVGGGMRLPAGSGAGPMLQINGPITVNPAPGQSGADVADDFMARIDQLWEQKFSSKMDEAYPGVVR